MKTGQISITIKRNRVYDDAGNVIETHAVGRLRRLIAPPMIRKLAMVIAYLMTTRRCAVDTLLRKRDYPGVTG